MARSKRTAVQDAGGKTSTSNGHISEAPSKSPGRSNGHSTSPAAGLPRKDVKKALEPVTAPAQQSGLTQLLICVGGIYASFLSWALLQERITTTTYGPYAQKWTYSIALNTVQSTFAAITGLAYLYLSTPAGSATPSPFPSARILGPLLLVAVTSSLASPFGYAALAHVDYVTFILAKSCKLLPVMFLHLTVFRRRYPLEKYVVVGLVTVGVAVFTLHQPASAAKKHKGGGGGGASPSTWGLFLLAINLLLDGLTNSTQDQIFRSFRPYSGPQMMAANNALSTLLTAAYLSLLPLAPPALLTALSIPASSAAELSAAVAFVRANPAALKDVLAFAACGAVGQIFIYLTLARFSSLLLVTVTVTRKMLTMMLSVVWFGHRLSGMQWLGVGLVFGGVGAEGWLSKAEKQRKEKEKAGVEAKEGAAGKKEL